jgi:BMFP domain-containing protein YqiC
MQGDADKEISRLIEASRKAIQKIKEDVVKEVKQLLEKSIKKQTELVSLLDFKAQRWVYATRTSLRRF